MTFIYSSKHDLVCALYTFVLKAVTPKTEEMDQQLRIINFLVDDLIFGYQKPCWAAYNHFLKDFRKKSIS